MSRAIVEGLFEVDADGALLLIGSRCTTCGTARFPQAIACPDSACRGRAVERALLPARGTLHSFTIQRYQPPPAFRIDAWAPYAIALVDLGEGLQVMGMMKDVAFEALAIGMTVKLAEAVLHTDAAGETVTTYAFVPEDAA